MSILLRRLVRVAATVVLAGCLVSGLATGTRDAAAQVTAVGALRELRFGFVAGDADLAGTVVISPASAKTVTGGASDFGDVHESTEFEIETDPAGGAYSCTLPSSIQVTTGSVNATVDTFTTNPALSGSLPPGDEKMSIFIGATLHLAAGQAAGQYKADLTLTCDGFSNKKDAIVDIFAPISISSSGDMDFGTMLTTGTAGTVTVTPAGARSSVDVDLFGGFPAAASFDVTGAVNQAYSITLPSSATLSSGGNTMTVDTIPMTPAGLPNLAAAAATPSTSVRRYTWSRHRG